MHQYDIASKILMETCRDELIRYFAGIEVEESTIIEELPQETVSVKRSDFPIRVKAKNNQESLMLFELQTDWRKEVPLHLMDYRARYLIKYGLKTVTYVVLLKPSRAATNVYKDNEIRYAYNLIRIYEMSAREILDQGPLCLMPFIPLMKYGPDLLDQADDLIYQSEKTRLEKADMLTSMAILAGIISTDLPVQLINRRKDIMIESAAYDIIKKDGIKEGIQQGLKQGLKKGLEEGKKETLLEFLEARFGAVSEEVVAGIRKIDTEAHLKLLVRIAASCENLEEFKREMR